MIEQKQKYDYNDKKTHFNGVGCLRKTSPTDSMNFEVNIYIIQCLIKYNY